MKCRWQTLGIALVATVLLTGSAFAQRRGGFGGPGGPGGGMLLRMPEVQTELKLTEEQKTKLTQMQDRLREERQGQFEQLRDLSPEERQKKFAEWRAGEEKQLKAILNEDQMKRYRQLQLQRQGLSALRETEVQEALKLTTDQRSKVETILTEQREEMRKAFEGAGGGPGGDPAAAREKFEALRKKTDTKLEAVLTDDQKKQWKEMLGASFTFPQFQFRPPGAGA